MDANQAIAYISLRRELDSPEDEELTVGAMPVTHGEMRGHTSIDGPRINSDTTVIRQDVRLPGGPKDRCNLIYLSLVISGVGFLLPYNVFINAVDFYHNRYGTLRIMFDITTTYIIVMLFSVSFNNAVMNRFNFQWRISAGYLLALSVLFGVTLLDVYLNLFSITVSYRLTVTAAALVSMGCTVQQSSFYGYASMLPRRFAQAVMTGESAAGFIISLFRMLTKSGLFREDNTAFFFFLSTFLLLFCFIIFHIGLRSEFVKFHVQTQTQEERVHLNTYTPKPMTNAAYSASKEDGSDDEVQFRSDEHLPDLVVTMTPERSVCSWEAFKKGVMVRWRVTQNIWTYMLAIGLNYCVTLCLFPSIISGIPSQRWPNTMPILLMLIFNGFDLLGKIHAGIPIKWNGRCLIISSLTRVPLVPLILLCAIPTDIPYIHGETWPMLFMAVLGLSNGYLGSVPMIRAPQQVQTTHKEAAGNLMTLSYSIGLTIGAAIAYGLYALVV